MSSVTAISDPAMSGKRRLVALAVLAMVAAVLLNKWAIERVAVHDEYIRSWANIAPIVLLQLALFCTGVWLLIRRAAIRLTPFVHTGALLVLSVACAVGIYGNLKALHVIDPQRDFRLTWERVMKNEELILILTPRLKTLAASVMDLEFPDEGARALFAPTVSVRDLATPVTEALHAHALPSDVRTWEVALEAEPSLRADDELVLWSNIFDATAYFENAKFKFVTGEMKADAANQFESNIVFDGLARLKSGDYIGIKMYQNVRWERVADTTAQDLPEQDRWKIAEWNIQKVKIQSSDRLLFKDELDRALSVADAARARRSLHEEDVARFLRDKEKFKAPHEFFRLPSWDRHPAVAVVDLDHDGFDDIYLMDQTGKNQLFMNRGDGTFVEDAARWGLDVDSHTNGAVFVDLDNDGDADAILGRSLAQSMYLVNENGRFVDRTATLVDGRMPHLAGSVSAADYNNDGLIDVYISTYAAEILTLSKPAQWRHLLSDEDAAEIERLQKSAKNHRFMNRIGPPNVLLRNVGGGRLEVATDVPELRVFLNTYQSTWGDYDDDGDVDLYVANDFAPNNLFRNDGNGHFTDVSAATGTEDIGFGMGATWGDYNGDLRQDLYVSNMFSKAGRRIIGQLEGVDSRFAKMANGNSLFRNDGERFTKVSGLEAPAILVEEVGWSWGSQFVDANNDGALDLFALSGFYTAPADYELPVDI